MDYVDRTFDNGEVVVLDGNSFTNCTFRNAVLNFAGRSLQMSNCHFERFSMQFGGDLANGLFALYQLFGQEGMIAIIRGFTEPPSGKETILPGSPPPG